MYMARLCDIKDESECQSHGGKFSYGFLRS